MSDFFSTSVDLTDQCGATVSVPNYRRDSVNLSMGGDLSLSITMPAESAKAFGEALIAAAEETRPD